MLAFRKRFEQFAGRKLHISPPTCDCEQCKLITAAVKAKLPEMKSRNENILLLTSLPFSVTITQMREEMGVTTYAARVASLLRSDNGPFSCPDWKPTGRPLSDKVKEVIIDFYLSNDNSRVNTTARECVYIKNGQGLREKKAKQTMLMNLKDAFLSSRRSIRILKSE